MRKSTKPQAMEEKTLGGEPHSGIKVKLSGEAGQTSGKQIGYWEQIVPSCPSRQILGKLPIKWISLGTNRVSKLGNAGKSRYGGEGGICPEPLILLGFWPF